MYEDHSRLALTAAWKEVEASDLAAAVSAQLLALVGSYLTIEAPPLMRLLTRYHQLPFETLSGYRVLFRLVSPDEEAKLAAAERGDRKGDSKGGTAAGADAAGKQSDGKTRVALRSDSAPADPIHKQAAEALAAMKPYTCGEGIPVAAVDDIIASLEGAGAGGSRSRSPSPARKKEGFLDKIKLF